MYLVAALFALLAFGLCSLLFWINSQQRNFFGAAAFTIALNSLQISALYGQIELEWYALLFLVECLCVRVHALMAYDRPQVAKNFLNALSFANLNLDLTQPECKVQIGNVFLFKW